MRNTYYSQSNVCCLQLAILELGQTEISMLLLDSFWVHYSSLDAGKGTRSLSSICNNRVIGTCWFGENLQFPVHGLPV